MRINSGQGGRAGARGRRRGRDLARPGLTTQLPRGPTRAPRRGWATTPGLCRRKQEAGAAGAHRSGLLLLAPAAHGARRNSGRL